eukprot:SAG22_NODE_2_length_61565_cov_858.782010_45_plen_97_part_00
MKYSNPFKSKIIAFDDQKALLPKQKVICQASARPIPAPQGRSFVSQTVTIDNSFEKVKDYYDNTLNLDKSTYISSNDEPTSISCILRMVKEIPEEL